MTLLHLYRPAAAVRRRWRQRLQLRVVTATMLLGLLVVLALGQFLYERISAGLMEEGRRAAFDESARLSQEIQQAMSASPVTEDVSVKVHGVVSTYRGRTGEPDRSVIMLKALSSTEPGPPADRAAGWVRQEDISPTLREQVNQRPLRQRSQQIRLNGTDQDSRPDADRQGGPRDAIVVGQIVTLPSPGGPYELYFAFPLDREREILAVVRRTFVVGGVALVLLVGAVAYTVTRQVVSPVRQAAHTAEELASGRLDRRMRVGGDDEIARLGRAFNEMAASLERQITELEELSRVQQRFVADVSHELRTPLTTLRMAGELIYEARQSFDPALSRSAELLRGQLDRFEALLADLLEISRFDARAAVLDAEQADVRDVARRVIDDLVPLAERRHTLLRLHAPADPCLAEVDPRRVQRVVRNLIGNAIEHAEERPIDITVAASPDAVAISVRDYGSGLDGEQLNRVFDRFWRGDPARARATGGTGLGLAISSEDAQLHGGRLQVWSRPGAGANFLLTLPLRPGDPILEPPLPLVPVTEGDRAPTAELKRGPQLDRSGAAPDPEPASGSAAESAAGPAAPDDAPAGVPHA